MDIIQIKVSDVIWRKDLYPRFNPNPQTIQQYADSIDSLPPIEINQRNELIDGYHRWTAYKKLGLEYIQATVTNTENDTQLLWYAVERNAKHGLQLSNAEKKDFALKVYSGKTKQKDDLSSLLSVSRKTIDNWLSDKDKAYREERNRIIQEMWFACYTQEEIAERVDIPRQTISDKIKNLPKMENFPKSANSALYQDTDIPLYDVWTASTKSNEVNHFGNSEAKWVDNLIYMYTQPFDIVVDPFAGGGATIDVCKKRLRRYWVSDRLPIVEREQEIRKHDILDGTPKLPEWKSASLLYLDPPYWKQAQNEYSKDANDLANMPLDMFYETLSKFIKECAAKMYNGSHIALIIQPTQWKADSRAYPADHITDMILALNNFKKTKYVRRIQVPYSTQQYNPQQVEWAKKNRDILVISREIIVWEVIKDG